MTTHIDAIGAILNTLTSLTITKHPEFLDYGYNLVPIDDIKDQTPYDYVEAYKLVIKTETLVQLETAIETFNTCDSDHPDGYQSAGTEDYPYRINVNMILKINTFEYKAEYEIFGRWLK